MNQFGFLAENSLLLDGMASAEIIIYFDVKLPALQPLNEFTIREFLSIEVENARKTVQGSFEVWQLPNSGIFGGTSYRAEKHRRTQTDERCKNRRSSCPLPIRDCHMHKIICFFQ